LVTEPASSTITRKAITITAIISVLELKMTWENVVYRRENLFHQCIITNMEIPFGSDDPSQTSIKPTGLQREIKQAPL
jgi:hypothetical protein